MNFVKWFRSEPHRDKYEADHPAFLAAREAWNASKKDREWVSVTDDEINEVLGGDIRDEPSGALEFVRAIEAKLKEKNT